MQGSWRLVKVWNQTVSQGKKTDLFSTMTGYLYQITAIYNYMYSSPSMTTNS